MYRKLRIKIALSSIAVLLAVPSLKLMQMLK